MPTIPVPEAERPVGPNVFGTIALPVRPRPTSTRWSKVMRAPLAQPMLERLTSDARALSAEQGLAYIQSAVNRAVRPNTGPNNCSDDGYWAPAQETLARGLGDCFDVAIAKMEALRKLGFADRDMYLTTGWFRGGELGGGAEGKGRESVALLVRVGDRFWLLPEQSGQAIAADSGMGPMGEFTPVVTYGVGMTWIHGKVIKVAATTPSPVGLTPPVR